MESSTEKKSGSKRPVASDSARKKGNMKFNVVKMGGEWHLVAEGSPAEKDPSVLETAPGWATHEEAELAAKENTEKVWLD